MKRFRCILIDFSARIEVFVILATFLLIFSVFKFIFVEKFAKITSLLPQLRDCELLHKFRGHRGPVTALAFRITRGQ